MEEIVDFRNIEKKITEFDPVPGLNSPKLDARISIQNFESGTSKKYCTAKLASAQYIGSNIGSFLGYSVFDTNTDTMSATSGQITIPESGLYLINLATQWQDASGGNPIRQSVLYINGNQACYDNTPCVVDCMNTLSFFVSLDQGDYIKVQAYQDSGSYINVYSSYSYLQVVSL